MAQQPKLSETEIDRLMNIQWSEENTVAHEEQHVESRAPISDENAPHVNVAHEDIPECSNARAFPDNKLPPMPKSWEDIIQGAVKDFQNAPEVFLHSQSLVEKLEALEQNGHVIQSLMVKVVGLVATDPDDSYTLRAGLEEITSRFRKECHAFYLQHERGISTKNGEKLHRLIPAFKEKLSDLKAPFADIQFHCSSGPVSSHIVADKWSALATASFNKKVNQFQTELVDKRATRSAALVCAKFCSRGSC
jgi:hypothetical protein